jgi:hypothetical protein
MMVILTLSLQIKNLKVLKKIRRKHMEVSSNLKRRKLKKILLKIRKKRNRHQVLMNPPSTHPITESKVKKKWTSFKSNPRKIEQLRLELVIPKCLRLSSTLLIIRVLCSFQMGPGIKELSWTVILKARA